MPRRPFDLVFMRAVVNPIVTFILRTPAHGLVSGSLVLLTIRGRKTGREHTVPVQYVAAGGDLYVLPGRPQLKQWWRNLVGGAPVRVRLRGRDLTGRAEALSGHRDSPALAEGMRVYLQRFPSASTRLDPMKPVVLVRIRIEGAPERTP